MYADVVQLSRAQSRHVWPPGPARVRDRWARVTCLAQGVAHLPTRLSWQTAGFAVRGGLTWPGQPGGQRPAPGEGRPAGQVLLQGPLKASFLFPHYMFIVYSPPVIKVKNTKVRGLGKSRKALEKLLSVPPPDTSSPGVLAHLPRADTRAHGAGTARLPRPGTLALPQVTGGRPKAA